MIFIGQQQVMIIISVGIKICLFMCVEYISVFRTASHIFVVAIFGIFLELFVSQLLVQLHPCCNHTSVSNSASIIQTCENTAKWGLESVQCDHSIGSNRATFFNVDNVNHLATCFKPGSRACPNFQFLHYLHDSNLHNFT